MAGIPPSPKKVNEDLEFQFDGRYVYIHLIPCGKGCEDYGFKVSAIRQI